MYTHHALRASTPYYYVVILYHSRSLVVPPVDKKPNKKKDNVGTEWEAMFPIDNFVFYSVLGGTVVNSACKVAP